MVARPVAPRALQYPVVGAALLAILGTSVAPPLPIARQRDRVRLYAFHGGPVGFDIAAARGAILSALRAAGFSVEDRLLSSDVEIGSSVTCAATAADGPRLVHAHTRLRTAETGARLDLHAAALCGRGAEPTREEVIRVFSSEVIDRIGRGWSRRTNADRQ